MNVERKSKDDASGNIEYNTWAEGYANKLQGN